MDKNQNTETITTATNQGASDWKQATGEINIRLVNDFLFRALLQRNNHVLKGLIAVLGVLTISPKGKITLMSNLLFR